MKKKNENEKRCKRSVDKVVVTKRIVRKVNVVAAASKPSVPSGYKKRGRLLLIISHSRSQPSVQSNASFRRYSHEIVLFYWYCIFVGPVVFCNRSAHGKHVLSTDTMKTCFAVSTYTTCFHTVLALFFRIARQDDSGVISGFC